MLTFSLHSVSRGLPYNQLSPCVSPCLLSFLTSSFSFFLFPPPAWREKVKILLLVPLSFSSSYPFLFPLFLLANLAETTSLVYWLSYGSTFQSISSSPLHWHSSRVDLTFALDLPIRRLLTQTAILRSCPPGASLILGLFGPSCSSSCRLDERQRRKTHSG